MNLLPTHRKRGGRILGTAPGGMAGVLLMEVMAALMLFGMGGTALIVALSNMADLSLESQISIHMQIRAQSKLTEFHKMNNLDREEGKSQPKSIDKFGVWTETTVTNVSKDYKTQDGQELSNIFKVEVVAYYEHNDKRLETRAEALRYLPLYKTSGAGATQGTQTPTPVTTQ